MELQSVIETLRKDPELAQKSEQAMNDILARSATDPAFRKKLLSEPREAVSEALGAPVSDDFNVVFIEKQGDATVVLPDPVDPAAELSSQDLESVSGGFWGIAVQTAAATIALTAETVRIIKRPRR